MSTSGKLGTFFQNLSARMAGFTAVLITLIIVSLFIGFYFFHYVANNEEKINRRQFRALDRIADNINQRLPDFHRLAISKSMTASKMKNANSDSIQKYFADSVPEFEWMGDRKNISNKPYFKLFIDKKDSVTTTTLHNEPYLVFHLTHIDNTKKDYLVGMKMSGFLSYLFRKDLFANYILLHDTVVDYSDFPHQVNMKFRDSLLANLGPFKARKIMNLNSDDSEYRIYTIPFVFNGMGEFKLMGALPVNQYNNERLSVPYYYISTLLFLILGIAIFFPFFKIYLMGRFERLRSADILLAVVSLSFGSGLLFFIFLDQFQYFTIDKPGYDEQQKSLTLELRNSFVKDVDSALMQLNTFDKNAGEFHKDIYNISIDPTEYSTKRRDPDFKASITPLISYPPFFRTFWLNKNGDHKFSWVNGDQVFGKSNFKTRDYFRNIQNEAFWQLSSQPSLPFVMQSVRSWVDGEFRAVIARRSTDTIKDKTIFLAAIATDLPSVINPVIPNGYKYCIVDEKGDVWFHSDRNLNTNENILEECNQNQYLQSAIYSRTSLFFKEQYGGSTQRLYITPIDKLPLYIITMRDLSPTLVKSLEIGAVTIYFFLCTLLLMGILLSLLLIFNLRTSKLRANKYRFDWLWPDRNRREEYFRITVLNIILLVFTLMLTHYFPSTITGGSELCIYLILFNIYISMTLYFYVSHSRIFRMLDENIIHTRFRIFIGISLALFVGLLVYLPNIQARAIAVGYFLIIIATVILLFGKHFYKNKKDREKLINQNKKENANLTNTNNKDNKKEFNGIFSIFLNSDHIRLFAAMIISWMCLISLVPVYKFYSLAYNLETEINARQNQLSWLKGINKFTNPASGSFSKNFILLPGDSGDFRNIYTEKKYFNTTVKYGIAKDSDTVKESIFNRGLKKMLLLVFNIKDLETVKERMFECGLNKMLRFVFNKTSGNEHMLGRFDDQDTMTLSWSSLKKNTLQLVALDPETSKNQTGDQLTISTVLPLYTLPRWSGNRIVFCVFWLSVISGIFIIYIIITHFINLMFLPDYFRENPDELIKPIRITPGSESPEKLRMIIISLPGSGKTDYIESTSEYQPYKKWLIDFVRLGETEEWEKEQDSINEAEKNDFIVIRHFEYGLTNKCLNELKFKFLENLTRKGYKNIIIISTIHPNVILNSIRLRTGTENQAVPCAMTHIESYFNWTRLLSSFDVIHYPLESNNEHYQNIPATMEEAFEQECNHGKYLRKLKKELSQHNDSVSQDFSYEDFENIVLHIQSVAHNYYLSLWNSLTFEEQYVLFDIAEDGLVNHKNFESLSQLHMKGLIINNGRPEVMNKSFRNFILTEVQVGHLALPDDSHKKDSLWSKFKGPFFVVFLALLFFIYYTQKESFNALTAVITGFAAAIPAFLNFFNTFKTKSSTP